MRDVRIMFTLSRAIRAASITLMAAVSVLGQPSGARAGVLAPIWTGAYAGFHGGGAWGSIDFNNISSSDTSGWSGGGHAGYNLGFAGFVAGVEGDLNYDGSNASYTFAGGGGSLDSSWNATLRGRVGLPVGPALFYATAGFARKGSTFVETNGAGLSASQDHTFVGAVYGIGAEAYVMPNMSVRLEALRYDYGAEKLSLSGAANTVQEIDPSDTVVRAGVTFHLN